MFHGLALAGSGKNQSVGASTFEIGRTFLDPIIKFSNCVLSAGEESFLILVVRAVVSDSKGGSNCPSNSFNTAWSNTKTMICHSSSQTELSLHLIEAVHLVSVYIVFLVVIFVSTLPLFGKSLGISSKIGPKKVTIKRKNTSRLLEINNL